MNIRLLVHGAPSLHPDLLSEVEESVREGCGDGGEAQSILRRTRRRMHQIHLFGGDA